MNVLKEFSIPIKGLRNGVHEFDFQIGSDFFGQFDGSPIQKGEFEVHLTFDKRDSLFDLTFDFDGSIVTDCDRCAASINLPIGDTQFLTVKMSEETTEEDADVVFIHPDASELNVSQYVYEFICLAMPYNKLYDCENDDPRPCDMEALKKLDPSVSEAEDFINKTSDEPNDKKNPFEDLKKLFDN